MIEIPEAATLARQAAEALTGREITEVEANHTPHRLMWFFGDPARYPELLAGRRVTGATAWAGHLEIAAGDVLVVLSEGAAPRLLPAGVPVPPKHQLRLGFDDGSTLVVTVAMYGGVQVFHDGENDNPYYQVARAKPSPLGPGFDDAYTAALFDGAEKLSAKAFLATEQRVPGLGNGVLQDILWNAGVHPRRKIATLGDAERAVLIGAVRDTLRAMTDAGGRDTERDLTGAPGGYPTALSRATLELPCRRCGGRVVKESYLGGAVYVCPGCQPL